MLVMPGLPHPRGGGRHRLFWKLVANAATQSLLAVSIAVATRAILASVRNQAPVWPELSLLVAAGLALYGLRILEAGTAEAVGQHYVAAVRLRLLRRLIAASRRSGTAQSSLGTTMARLTGDLNALRNWIATGLARGGVALLSIIILTGACLYIDISSGVVLLAWITSVLVVSALLVSPLRTRVSLARAERGRLSNRVASLVLAIRQRQPRVTLELQLPKIRSRNRSLRASLVRRTRLAQAMRLLPAATLPLAFGLVIAAGEAESNTDELVVILLLFSLASAMLGQVSRAIDYHVNFLESARRISAILAPDGTARAGTDTRVPVAQPTPAASRPLLETNPGGAL